MFENPGGGHALPPPWPPLPTPIHLCCVYIQRFCRPRTKPNVCENSFLSFKITISCLQYEANLLSTSQTKKYASLTTRKYFFTSFPFGTWLSNLHA